MRWVCLFLMICVAGCGHSAQHPHGKAADVAQAYFDALLNRDWANAYEKLHAEAKSRWRQEDFSKAAQQFRDQLGADSATAHISSCEERNNEAIAHVLVVAHANGKQRLLKEAVTLRRGETEWRIMPPAGFANMGR
jgi:hypothetical protein